MKAIFAIGEDGAMGNEGLLPWPSILPDFLFFKALTLNQTLIVGSNTFKSLPPLKDREIIVISKSSPGITLFNYFADHYDDSHILIGGPKLIRTLWYKIDELYLTIVKSSNLFKADSYLNNTILSDLHGRLPKAHLIMSRPSIKEVPSFSIYHINLRQ